MTTLQRLAATASVLAIALTACSAPAKPAPGQPTGQATAARTTAADAPIVPTAWLDKTKPGWETSDGKKQDADVLDSKAPCLLAKEPTVRGKKLSLLAAGYGPLPEGEGFKYTCHFVGGELKLYSIDDAAKAALIDNFENPPTYGGVRQAESTHVTSGRYQMIVARDWIPSNPQGNSRVLVVDEAQHAAVAVDTNIVKREEFDAYTPQRAADELAKILDENR